MSFETYVRIARQAGVNAPDALVAALRALDDDSTRVTWMMRYHHLAAPVLATIEEGGRRADVDARVLGAIERARADQPSARELLTAFEEIRRAFAARGAGVVLLKGIYLAHRLYGGYHRRPQYDLDVLVRAPHRSTARRALEALGFRKETADLHSQTFTRGPLKIDVHGWLRRAPAYRLDEDDIWRGVRIERLDGFEVPTLSDEYTLVLFALSCFEDLGQGMTKLKQLVDVYLWLRDVDASTNWSEFFERRSRERIDGIVAAVLALVLAVFDARDEVPRLSAALAGDRAASAMTRAQAIALVSAPRKHPANLAWFGRVYPGSFWHYLTRFWWAGFPQNLRGLQADRLRATLRAAGRRV